MEHTVSILAKRPASRAEECFHCNQRIGANHKPDCVLIKKKVKLRMIIEFEAAVPNHWDKTMVEFHRNYGTYCADNDLQDLQRLAEKEGCLCSRTDYEYLGDAGEEFLQEN